MAYEWWAAAVVATTNPSAPTRARNTECVVIEILLRRKTYAFSRRRETAVAAPRKKAAYGGAFRTGDKGSGGY
jgi:hypothetical protein